MFKEKLRLLKQSECFGARILGHVRPEKSTLLMRIECFEASFKLSASLKVEITEAS